VVTEREPIMFDIGFSDGGQLHACEPVKAGNDPAQHDRSSDQGDAVGEQI
jgi:hypothetical protein